MIAKYQRSDIWRSIWQIIDTFVPYFILLYGMYRSLEISYWITLALAVPAAGFQVRTFIIFHDCGHGSFFKSQKANDIVGMVSGLFSLTPYYEWRHNHAIHHATGSDLDNRGIGDVWMLTVKEYLERPVVEALRLSILQKSVGDVRHRPVVHVLCLAPVHIKLVRAERETKRLLDKHRSCSCYHRHKLHVSDSHSFVLVFLPTIWLAGIFGLWLFYVQHQYRGVYWARHTEWNFFASALKGSSFYKLPKVLQWFSGNIGFHHIHHLSPRVPNYSLSKCQKEIPLFWPVKPLTLLSSFHSLTLRLWDEDERMLVGFGKVRGAPRRM